MSFWQLDSTEPLVTPRQMLAYHSQQMRVGEDELRLPETLVATFQQQALHHLVKRVGGDPPTRWPTPALWPVSRGHYRGIPLAVARLPMGAASAVMALEMMIAAGVRRVLLAGSAGSLQSHLPTGSLVIPTRALRHEGTSHHYLAPGQEAAASPELVEALIDAAREQRQQLPTLATIWTTDALFRECMETVLRHREAGVAAVDMEAAAIFAVAAHRDVEAALVVALSDELVDGWTPGFHTLTFAQALISAADLALAAAGRLSASQ